MQAIKKASKYIFGTNQSAKTSPAFEKIIKLGYRI